MQSRQTAGEGTLNILRVGSVKTQTNFIVNHKWGDMFRLIDSSSGQFLNYI